MSYVRSLSLILFLLFCLRTKGSDAPGFYVSETGTVASNLVFTFGPGTVYKPDIKNVSGQYCFSLADFFSGSGIKFPDFTHSGPIGLRFSLFIPADVPDLEQAFYYYSSYAVRGRTLGILSTVGLKRSAWVTATVWLPSFQVADGDDALLFVSDIPENDFYFEYKSSFYRRLPFAEYGLIDEERKNTLKIKTQDYLSRIMVSSMAVFIPEPLSGAEYKRISKELSTLPGEDFLLQFFFVLLAVMVLLPLFLMKKHLSMKILLLLFLPVLPLILVLCLRAHEFFASLADNVNRNILEEQQQDFTRLDNLIYRTANAEEDILKALTDDLHQVIVKDQNEAGEIEFVLQHQSFREEWEETVKHYEEGDEEARAQLIVLSVRAVSRFEPHKHRFLNSLPINVKRSFNPKNPPLADAEDWKEFKNYIYSCSRNGSEIAALVQEIYWKFLLRICIHDHRFLIENNYNGPASRGGPAVVILVNQILRENDISPEKLPELVRENSRGFGELTEAIESGGININFLHGYFDQPRSFQAHPMQKGNGYSKEMWEIRRGRGNSRIIFRLLSDNFLQARLLCGLMEKLFPQDAKDYFVLSNIRTFDFPIRNFNHPYLVRGAVLAESGKIKGPIFFSDRENELFGLYAFPEEKLKPYIPAVGRFIHQDFIALKYLKLWYFVVGFLLIMAFGFCAVFISRHILQPLSMLAAGMDRIRRGDYGYELQVFSRDEFNKLSVICNKLRLFLAEKERLTGFLASETRESVNVQDFNTKKEAVAIIFCGILNSSDYEQMDFNAQSNIFNLFLNSVQEAIFTFDGSVDKFTGQACLGFFRAENVYARPLQTAAEIRRLIKELNQDFVRDGKGELAVGIGVATGNVVLGYIGSEKRRDFTSIGNTVNTAARLETFAKGRGSGASIFFDQETFRLNQEFLADSGLDYSCHEGIFLKGKQGEQVIYELL